MYLDPEKTEVDMRNPLTKKNQPIDRQRLYLVLGAKHNRIAAARAETLKGVAVPVRKYREGDPDTRVMDVTILASTSDGVSMSSVTQRILVTCPSCGFLCPFGKLHLHEHSKACMKRAGVRPPSSLSPSWSW
jgi:hypothetical protein